MTVTFGVAINAFQNNYQAQIMAETDRSYPRQIIDTYLLVPRSPGDFRIGCTPLEKAIPMGQTDRFECYLHSEGGFVGWVALEVSSYNRDYFEITLSPNKVKLASGDMSKTEMSVTNRGAPPGRYEIYGIGRSGDMVRSSYKVEIVVSNSE